MRNSITALLLLGLLFGNQLKAQTNIELSPSSIDYSTDCIEILVGSVVDFTSASSCGGTSAITLDRGARSVFTTAKRDFRYIFDDLGEYTLLCNLGSSNFGSTTVCISSVDALSDLSPAGAVPTVGEWGIIALMLTLLIVATLSHEQRITLARI